MTDPPSEKIPEKPPYGITEEQKLAAAEKVFRVALYWFGNICEVIEVELGQSELCGAHELRDAHCELVALS